jgi:hypothetical protein
MLVLPNPGDKSMSTSRVLWLVLVGVLLVGAEPARAQSDRSEKVRITTIDSVELIGNFYPCTDNKVRNPPVVLMLHPVGAPPKKSWVTLAETLQTKFAVMTFDFRGHGNSTEILPETFWKYPFNKGGVKYAPNKSTIEFKEFDKGYYPALVNDIAAVKGFLDRRNDSGSCNTSSFILLGAESGATLGALWLASEWHRFRLVQNPMFLQQVPDTRAEANDVIGCVWLSISSQLGSRPISLGSLLNISLAQKATPMVFLHSDEDSKGRTLALSMVKSIKANKDKAKYALTDRIEIKAGKLTGMDLVQKSLNTDAAILEYLQQVVDTKGREWGERDYRKTSYVWRYPLGAPNYITAKLPTDNNLVYDTYIKFMQGR